MAGRCPSSTDGSRGGSERVGPGKTRQVEKKSSIEKSLAACKTLARVKPKTFLRHCGGHRARLWRDWGVHVSRKRCGLPGGTQ